MKEKLTERLTRYASYDTQSDAAGGSYPSTAKQLLLLNDLVEEAVSIGLSGVEIDGYGYVTAAIPATKGCESAPVVGFLAHVDTSPDVTGAGVKPQVIESYDGGDIPLSGSGDLLSPADFPELQRLKGHTLVTSDGTTLLGADDKAGIAIILTAAEYLLAHPEIPHGPLRIAFTPDEEIGRGTDHFDVAAFGAQYAYTVDGGAEGELEYDNFNAAAARITIHGRNVHPGEAKGKMVSALELAMEFHSALPVNEKPQTTEGYEGFFHLYELSGDVEKATAEYIIRDHSLEKFEQRKALVRGLAASLGERYAARGVRVEADLHDQYYNMLQVVERTPKLIELARIAIREAGAVPHENPVRGGTDGARLSFMGLPCPNLFTGGANYHSRYEYCSVDSMQRAVHTVANLARLWGAEK